MSTTINLEELTNGIEVGGRWEGTGVFDKLIDAVNSNINLQYSQGRIKGAEYANVYLGSMQSVLSQSLEYLLKHELIAAQIDGEKANNNIKAVQLAEEQYKLDVLLPDEHSINTKKELEIDKSIDVQERNTTIQESKLADELVTADKQRLLLDKDAIIKDKQSVEEQYKIDILLPDEHSINAVKELSLSKDIDIKERSTVIQETESSDKLLLTAKQRDNIDADNAIKSVQLLEEQYKADTLLPDEHTLNLKKESELVATTAKIDADRQLIIDQDSELLANGLKDRSLKDIQINEEQYKVNTLLPDEHSINTINVNKLNKELDLLSQKIVGKKQSAVIAE